MFCILLVVPLRSQHFVMSIILLWNVITKLKHVFVCAVSWNWVWDTWGDLASTTWAPHNNEDLPQLPGRVPAGGEQASDNWGTTAEVGTEPTTREAGPLQEVPCTREGGSESECADCGYFGEYSEVDIWVRKGRGWRKLHKQRLHNFYNVFAITSCSLWHVVLQNHFLLTATISAVLPNLHRFRAHNIRLTQF